MALIVTTEELRQAVTDGDFITDGDPAAAEGVKYDFHVGTRILKAQFGSPIDTTQLSETEKGGLVVEPGEVVFVLTQERLALPNDMTAQLSPKRKLSHAGILTLGGFSIDPGYQGRLLVGLYNLSSTPFPLIPGKKLIAASFLRLTPAEAAGLSGTSETVEDFPDELVQVMRRYQPIGLHSLADGVQRLQAELVELRTEIRSHESWYERFKESLEANNEQISRLASELENEKEVRKSGEDELGKAVSSIERSLAFLRGAAWVVMGIVGIAAAVAAALVIKGLTGH